jgi:hypothetical protein
MVARRVSNHWSLRSGTGELARGAVDLGDDHPDVDEGRLCRTGPSAATHQGYWCHTVCQLVGETVLDGIVGVVVHSPLICPAIAC